MKANSQSTWLIKQGPDYGTIMLVAVVQHMEAAGSVPMSRDVGADVADEVIKTAMPVYTFFTHDCKDCLYHGYSSLTRKPAQKAMLQPT